jgi:hypothetical protein
MLNLYLLMYANDMVLFSESMHELQKNIDVVNQRLWYSLQDNNIIVYLCVMYLLWAKEGQIWHQLYQSLDESQTVRLWEYCAFNNIINTGIYPELWVQSIIIPVFKKGDVNEPKNYRGISLVSPVGKLFTGLLNKRFLKWAEQHNIPYFWVYSCIYNIIKTFSQNWN